MIRNKEFITESIKRIRKEIGHEDMIIRIKSINFNEKTNKLTIITPDRSDKSIIIGKGGWVVGRLKEELSVDTIHVIDYSDLLLKEHKLSLSLERLNEFIKIQEDFYTQEEMLPFYRLKELVVFRLNNLSNFDFLEYISDEIFNESNEDYKIRSLNEINSNEFIYNTPSHLNKGITVILALSGGVDSSFSLILLKLLGFNIKAVTVNPGTIVLPKQFKRNISNLNESLDIEHVYLEADYKEIIKESLNGKFHPCGRCSKKIDETILEFAKENGINFVIFGDMLSTGYQSIVERRNTNIINLPALLSIEKNEMKKTLKYFKVNIINGFGCPLLHEVETKYPFMKKYSIQRVLRETRSGALEPGEALDLIWKK